MYTVREKNKLSRLIFQQWYAVKFISVFFLLICSMFENKIYLKQKQILFQF